MRTPVGPVIAVAGTLLLLLVLPFTVSGATYIDKLTETFFERCSQGKDWIGYDGSCYRHFPEPRYWERAERFCRDQGGHLISVGSAFENSLLAKLTYCEPAWIGAYAVHVDRMTDPVNYRFTDGTNSQFHAFDFTATPPPLLHHPLIFAANQTWRNRVYHGQESFVCEVTAPQRNYTCNCPNGWKQLGGHCYLMPSFEATYIEADFYCRGRGAHVTSLHTAEELRAMSLMDIESRGCPADTWIGLLKLNPCRADFSGAGNNSSVGGPICYRWSDRTGDYTGFPAWHAGSPHTDLATNCVLLSNRGIKTVPCYTRARFVCKKKVEPRTNAGAFQLAG